MKTKILLASLIFANTLAAQVLEPDGIVGTVNDKSQTATKFAYVREADMMWAKRIWRVVDFKEKINQYMLFPLTENNNRINFMQMIIHGIDEGKIQTYDGSYDDFKVRLSRTEALNMGQSLDTIQLQRPYPPYEYYDTVIASDLDFMKIKKLKIKEDWYFDMKRSVMDVRIVGFCPVLEVYSKTTGDFIGLQDMYWINFDQARAYLATYKIYNPYNYAQRISYDDAFVKRIFSSMIYKEDNTMDRGILDYLKGMDALYEAEDVKNKIFTYEHDLWEQ